MVARLDAGGLHAPRSSSFDWMVSIVIVPAGLALAGPVAGLIGRDATLVVGALLIVAAAAAGIATPSVRALRASGA